MDGFLRLVVPPGHVVMTSFPYIHIGCDYGDLTMYGVIRSDRSIWPGNRLLCEGSDLLPLLWFIVVITAFSMRHSHFCEGYRLEVIFRFFIWYLQLFLFVWLFGCFDFVCLFVVVVVWGWGLFCFVYIGLRVFDCCFLCVLLSLAVDCFVFSFLFSLFFFFLYMGGGSFFIRSALWSTVFILCFYIRLLPPFLLMLILLYPHSVCRDWYECASECTWHHDICCNIRLPVKTGLDVRVSVHHDTLHEL